MEKEVVLPAVVGDDDEQQTCLEEEEEEGDRGSDQLPRWLRRQSID